MLSQMSLDGTLGMPYGQVDLVIWVGCCIAAWLLVPKRRKFSILNGDFFAVLACTLVILVLPWILFVGAEIKWVIEAVVCGWLILLARKVENTPLP